MTQLIVPGTGLVFMKVGLHAQETIEDIILRKQREFEEAGMIFWGYGGNTCHPKTFIQPFAKQLESEHKPVHLVMNKMDSKHFAEPELAKEYSEDGLEWKPIPQGVEVRGSRYAMVLGNLNEDEFDLNLLEMVVAMGNSRGRLAQDYLKGRVDKGCFEVISKPDEVNHVEPEIKHIDLVAPLQAPYAVFLK